MSLNNYEKYQTIALRFMAMIIDSIVLIPLWLFGSYLNSSVGSTSLSTFVINSLIGLAAVFYYILMHAFFGRTIGKMLMKVRVVDVFETSINLGQSAIRSLPQLVPLLVTLSFENPQGWSGNATQWDVQLAASLKFLLTIFLLVWTVLNVLIALSGDKHRALHDYLAGTIVVKTNV